MIAPRLLRLCLSLALFAVALVAGPISPAHAAGDYLEVSISSISTPTIDLADPDQEITLTGTITNVSTVPIRFANVHFWRSPTPLTGAEELATALASPPAGERLTSAEDNYFTISQDDEFGPGERVDFKVSGTVAQLTREGTPMRATDAVYLLGVQVRGLPNDALARSVVGRDTIAVAATTKATESSAIVLLTATPTWRTDGTFLDNSLESELGGRLEALLTSAERPDVVAALDPALYAAAKRMSTAYTVGDDEHPGSGVALRWVRRVDDLLATGRVWRVPYGNPDLVRASATGVLKQVLEASEAATPAEFLELRSVALLSPGADASLLTSLTGLDTVVLERGSGSHAGTPSVIASTSLTNLGSLSEGVQLARLIADEQVATRPPLYLISTEADARRDAQLGEHRTHTEPSTLPQEPLVWAAGPATSAWEDLTATLRQAQGDANLLAELTGTASTDTQSLAATAFSADFTTQAEAVDWVEESAPDKIKSGAITLRAAKSFVMGSRTNTFPATLTNKLDVPITVNIEFTSDSPQRIRVPSLTEVTVGPGEALTLEIVPEASANGVSLVHAQVTTTTGIPLSEPVTIEITATDLGRVGWIIIVVSGMVVLGGTAWRIRTVRRDRAKEEAQS